MITMHQTMTTDEQYTMYNGMDFDNATASPTVPHSHSGVAPMSSLSGVEQLGLWELGEGGESGQQGGGKQGQFTSNLRRGRTIPVTAGGRK
jgi:hypothetical protein